jgi:hypothetical protein
MDLRYVVHRVALAGLAIVLVWAEVHAVRWIWSFEDDRPAASRVLRVPVDEPRRPRRLRWVGVHERDFPLKAATALVVFAGVAGLFFAVREVLAEERHRRESR